MEISKININNRNVQNSYLKKTIAFSGQKPPINPQDEFLTPNSKKKRKSSGIIQKIKSFFKQNSSAESITTKKIDPLEDAIKAGHVFGHHIQRDGKWFVFDKTKGEFIEDTAMKKKVEAALKDFPVETSLPQKETTPLEAAIKAGHVFGHHIQRDGKWLVYDKTAHTFLEDKEMQKKVDAALKHDSTSYAAQNLSQRQQMLVDKYGHANISVVQWENMIKDEYAKIRQIGNYAVDYGADNYSDSIKNIQDEIYTPTDSLVHIVPQDLWFFRMKNYIESSDLGQRMSLNVKASSELIRNLDRLMTKGEYVDSKGKHKKINQTEFYYKTYFNCGDWALRCDPVTLYFKGDVNQETIDAIAQITKGFARGPLDGANEDTPWMSIEQSPKEYMISEIIKEAEHLDINLAEAIKACSHGGERCSSGYLKAFENIVAEYREYLDIKNS